MRRKILFVIISCSIYLTISAQNFENKELYFSEGIGIGNCFGYELNANCIFNKRFSLSAGYSSFIRVSKTLPEDYELGAFDAAFFFFILPIPIDKIKNYQILTGKVWSFKNKPKIRLNTQIGMGYSYLSYASNWKKEESYGFSANYSHEQINENAFSLIIKPSIEFLQTTEYGWFIAPMFIINEKYNLFFSVNVGFIFGNIKSLLSNKI